MKFFENFDLVKGKQYFKISYKGSPFILISKKGLAEIVCEYGSSLIASFDKKESLEVHKDDAKVEQFINAYTAAKSRFYNNAKLRMVFTKKDKEYKEFVKAVEIADSNNIDYALYIKAQVEGLSFANNGNGIFPSPKQLATVGAEDRLMRYLRENNKLGSNQVILSNADRTLHLKNNMDFKEAYLRVKKGEGTLKDALYVRELFIFKKKPVKPFVEDFIEKYRS